MVPGTAVSAGASNVYVTFYYQRDWSATPDCDDKSGIFGAVSVPGSWVLTNTVFQQDGEKYAVWDFGVPGVGIAYAARINRSGAWIPITSADQKLGLLERKNLSDPMYFEFRATLVYTGRLKTGNYRISTSIVPKLHQVSTGARLSYNVTNIEGRVDVKTRTCSMTGSTSQLVTLPQVASYTMKQIGSASQVSSAPFSFALRCDANVKVYATMTDVSNPANTSDALSLATGSSAKGVGIHIYRQNESTPIRYGPDSSANGNTNQWYVGTSATGGIVGLSFIAKYVKTEPTITPGTVSGLSTITFSYQ